jgi:hypothetical protein
MIITDFGVGMKRDSPSLDKVISWIPEGKIWRLVPGFRGKAPTAIEER